LPWPYDFLCLGVSDYLAEDEHHALYLAREIVRTLNWKKLEPLPPSHLVPKVDPPLYDPDELLGIVSADVKVPFEAREVVPFCFVKLSFFAC